MSKNHRKSCTFCLKTASEVKLIDTRTNMLQIEHNLIEFKTIFKDLLNCNPSNDFTCEQCKDNFVNFYMFKRSIKIPQDPVRFIYSQVDDFLSQRDISVNDIKIVRTINSITLQHEGDKRVEVEEKHPIKSEEEHIEESFMEEDTSQFEEFNTPVSCRECEKIEANEIDLEIHEFLKHTTFGIQLETEIDNCKALVDHYEGTSTIYVCSMCSSQIDNSDILLLHFLEDHCNEIIAQINTNLMKMIEDPQIIINYLNYIKDCFNGTNQEMVSDLDDRNYFYEVYKVTEDEEMTENNFDQTVQEQSDIEMGEEYLDDDKKRTEKSSDLSEEEKSWLREEIQRGKAYDDAKGRVFRCTISKSCDYVSNSSPGLRYHLIQKHLKDRKKLIEERKAEENLYPQTPYTKAFGSRNTCTDCCLKFKDNRGYQLHESCHNLFKNVAQHAFFPVCQTCSMKFADMDSLNEHLSRHELGRNLKDPIKIPNGAVKEQGKPLKFAAKVHSFGETSETEYTWKCGHCRNLNFTSEDYCNFHLLIHHVTIFSCPIDRMEFSGFKSVSLFIHHLRNKHPELFPNLTFKCTFCHMEFSSIYDKLQHMKNCDSKQFQCDHCEKRFFKKTELVSHLKIVSGEVQFECQVCYKKCISQSDLKIHLRSHTKDKPYPCSICNKSFRTLAARANHVEGHNANQNYSCELCEKTFKQRQMYRRHMKTIHERKTE